MTHSGEKPNKCKYCNYASSQRAYLATHMKRHREDKPYKCKQCDFEAYYGGHLRAHIMTHSAEKSNKCTQCEFACIQKGNMKRHMMIHSGEKPYKCIYIYYKYYIKKMDFVYISFDTFLNSGDIHRNCYILFCMKSI